MITILGKSPAMVSMLAAHHRLPMSIVRNVPDETTLPFALDEWFEEIEQDDFKWRGERVHMGVVRVPTKFAVYESFFGSHGIQTRNYANYIDSSAVIAPYAELGFVVTVNRGAMVGHHSKIGDFCTLNPGANIAGGVEIGARTTIGMGANVFDGVKIGDDVIIGAGSLVTKDIPSGVVAYGSPAKIVRER